jgi:hypothetical protein
VDDRAAAARIFDVLDAYGYFSADDLGEPVRLRWMDIDFREVRARTCSMVNGCTTSLP